MNDIGTMTDREELQPRGEAEARGPQMLAAAILPHQAPAVAEHEERQPEIEAEAHRPQMLAAAFLPHQPTEAPAAAEPEAEDNQDYPLERAVLEPAAEDGGQLPLSSEPGHLQPFEEVPLEQEEGEAWGPFVPADPEAEDALRDGYHLVGEDM